MRNRKREAVYLAVFGERNGVALSLQGGRIETLSSCCRRTGSERLGALPAAPVLCPGHD